MNPKKTSVLITSGGCMLLFFLTACSMPAEESTPDIATRVAQTLMALETPVTPTPSATAAPPDTPRPTDTPQPTETASPSTTPTPSETPTAVSTGTPTLLPGTPATAQPPGNRILFEDFESGSGWYVNEGENAVFEYTDGGYQITNNLASAQFWSVRPVDPADIIQEVDVKRVSGPVDGYFGVVCRHQEDGRNYYALVIGENGFYGIAIMVDGSFSFLAGGQDDKNIIDKKEGAVNRVRGDCVGDQLRLYANNQFLVEIENGTFESGQLGVFNGTRAEGGLVVLFDNYAIYVP